MKVMKDMKGVGFSMLVLCFLLFVAPGQVSTQQAGIITGRIETERAGVRTPVRRARVVLTREGAKDSSTTTTDGDARYRFDGLAPGKYVVAVEKPGFASIASTPIDIGGASRPVDLLMAPGGALEGRLQDDRNAAIDRVAVTAERLTEQGAVAASYAATSDDLGHFRIHSLPAGRYRLRATPSPPASGAQYFYPGTTADSEARVVTVTAGVTSDRLDFIVPVAPLSPTAAAAIEGAVQVATNDVADPKTARITGTVTRSDTGQPIANATAQLTDQTGSVRHRAKTGVDGQFEIAKIPAGAWALSAVATGFASVDATVVRPAGAGIRLTLKEGDRIQKDVLLARVSAIEGRVLDEFGDPAPGVVVQVAQKGTAVGLSRFLTSPSVGPTGMTDDRGWFRAPGLFPGDYFLIAVPQPFEKSWMTGFAPTFFPGTTAADGASPISIVSGRDVYDARFAIAPARTGTVAGQVVDASGQPVPKTQVMLMPVEDGEVRAMVMVRADVDAGGTFSFTGVPDGTYVVQSFGAGGFGVAAITLDAAKGGPRPAKVIMKAMTTARGRVVFEGEPAAPPREPPSLMIGFQPTSFTTGPVGSNRIAVTIHPDWTFEIPNLAWFGVLRVNPPPGWTFLRVRHEGRDITDTPFDFQSADVSGLEVVMTNRVGTVSGTITSAGQAAPGARVVIFGADDTSWTYLTRTMTIGKSNDRGAFSVEGLVPGRYLAVAISADMKLPDQASLLTLRSLAVPFTVTQSTNTVVALSLIK